MKELLFPVMTLEEDFSIFYKMNILSILPSSVWWSACCHKLDVGARSLKLCDGKHTIPRASAADDVGSLTHNNNRDIDSEGQLTFPGLVLKDIKCGSSILAKIPNTESQVQRISIWNKNIEVIKSRNVNDDDMYAKF